MQETSYRMMRAVDSVKSESSAFVTQTGFEWQHAQSSWLNSDQNVGFDVESEHEGKTGIVHIENFNPPQ
jgi:hypothetical protein